MTSPQPFVSRSHLFALAFFAVFLFLLYEMLRILSPFGSALLLAAILVIPLHPLYRRMVVLLHGYQTLAASVMTVVVILLVIGPAMALLSVLTSQAVEVYRGISVSLQSGTLPETWAKAVDLFSSKIGEYPFLSGVDVKGILLNGLGSVSSGLAAQFGTLLKNALILIVDLLVMLIALFFFFRNGESYYRSFIDMLPFPQVHKTSVAGKVHDTFIAVINGVFLIAIVQGVVTGIGFSLFGLAYPVFWGFLAAILALLPVGGAALVWAPGALFLFLKGATLRSVLLFFWGLVLVTLPDNVLKPLLIGRRAKIPSFFLFIGILGGLHVYGVFGILLGPIIVTMLTAFIQIYREEYADS